MQDRLTKLPRPSADNKLYNSIRQQGFSAYPDRERNYRNFLAASRTEEISYSPVMLDIENVSRCNYRCIMCQLSKWAGGRRAGDMGLDDFKTLIDDQPGLLEIKLQGMGEPLLGGDTYFEMIKYARSKHLWVRSTTNASLLHHNENYKKLIDADICEIQVSIDGTTPESYAAIRKGGTLSKVMKNTSLLNEYCRSANRMRTRMWVVVQRANFDELENFPALAAELGFTRLTLSLDLNDFGQEAWKNRNDAIDMHLQFTVERARQLIALGEHLGVEVTFWFIDEKFDASDKAKLCPWPFQRVFVSSDMRIVPCCMISNPEIMDLGDALRLHDNWNNKKMVAFRQRHLSDDIPGMCLSCYQNSIN